MSRPITSLPVNASLPGRNAGAELLDNSAGRIRLQPELANLRKRIDQRGRHGLVASLHRLVAQTLRAEHHIERRRQQVVAIGLTQQGVVFLWSSVLSIRMLKAMRLESRVCWLWEGRRFLRQEMSAKRPDLPDNSPTKPVAIFLIAAYANIY